MTIPENSGHASHPFPRPVQAVISQRQQALMGQESQTWSSAASWKAWMHVSSRQAQTPTPVDTSRYRETIQALSLAQLGPVLKVLPRVG